MPTFRSASTTVCVTACAAALAFGSGASGAAVPISIAAARTQPPGSQVTVAGVVSVAAGTFATSSGDQGFALQDATGGVYVAIAENPGLHRNVRAQVTGTLADDGNGLLVLRADSTGIVERRSAAAPVPEPFATGAIGEGSEGRLVEVAGTITQAATSDLPYGYKFFIDDGSGETQVFIAATTGVNPYLIPYLQPGRAVRISGFSAQYQQQYEVLPRSRDDFRAGY